MSSYVRVLALFAFSTACLAQTAPSDATPGAQVPEHSTPILRTTSQLVVVDVVVTDKSNKPVHGLTAADFTLLENGAPQRVRSFEEHSTLAAPSAPVVPLPPGVFTNQPTVPPGGAVTILLMDSLNTPTSDQAYLHEQLKAYLKSATPGSRIAIFGLSDHLLLLQGFDSDPAVLRKAMEKINVKASTVRSDVAGDGIQNSAADTFEDMGTTDPAVAQMIANLRQWDAQQKSLELQTRAKYTIDAFNQLALSLAAIPGRKNLIWFSASFPLDVPPDTTDNLASNGQPANDGFLSAYAGEADVAKEFQQAIDRLSRSQVAVYPIDVRGVTQSAVYAADTTRNYTGSRGVARFSADQNQFINDTVAENSTMTSLASATGGHAYISTNDLAQAVKESVEQGSNFYSLSYTPTDPATDGKLRHIKVQLSHPGVTLAYRQSYYATPPDQVKTTGLITQVSASLPQADPTVVALRTNLRLAMTRGAPVPTDILFRLGVVPMTPADKPEVAAAQYNTPTEKGNGPWRRFSVNYQIDPAGLVFFRAPDGKIHSDFDLLVYVFTAQGERVNVVRDARSFAGNDAQVHDFFQHGIVQHLEVSVPAKGEYFLRVAVHDLHRDHYGAIEVAASQVSNLVPADGTASSQAAPGALAK